MGYSDIVISGMKSFGRDSDRILFYGKSNEVTWNQLSQPLKEDYVERTYRYDDGGRRYRLNPLHAEGLSGGGYEYEWNGHNRVWRYPIDGMRDMESRNRLHYSKTGLANRKFYLDESKGTPLQATWVDIKHPHGKERLGYATQKPLALLDRIIRASSNEGDVVFDPFCSCATTIEAAHKLGRRWVGSILRFMRSNALQRSAFRTGLAWSKERTLPLLDFLARWKVRKTFGSGTSITSRNGPWRRLTGSLRPAKLAMVGLMASLIVLEDLGERKIRNFRQEMASAGDIEVNGIPYARMQMLTVSEVLNGKRFITPGAVGRGLAQPSLPLGQEVQAYNL